MSPVKEKEWEVCKLWGSVAFWVKGIHGYVYIEEATQNKSSLCHGESVVYIISEAEADSHLSSKAKDSRCMAWKRNVQLLSYVQNGDLLCRQEQPLQIQMDAASVKPALTLWQLSGMQSGNTIWDVAFPT